MLKEFKEFAFKGNLIDIAVGLVMATAFGKVVSAFVDGMFMPLVGKIFQLGNLESWKYVLAPATMGADGKEVAEVSVQYGNFIGGVINFLIVSFIMYMIIKGMNAAKAPEAPAPAPGPTQEELLAQIRDLLKK
jgi:large conductance mechanosensitive channel